MLELCMYGMSRPCVCAKMHNGLSHRLRFWECSMSADLTTSGIKVNRQP